jgi:hypothetical protein
MTERQPGRDGSEGRQSPRARPDPAGTRPVPERSGSERDEATLFNTDPGPRIFGEGSYAEGGSNQEGNFKEREASPQGSRGSFDDAGGYGGKQLLGGRKAGEAAEQSRRASDDKTGPDETVDDS